MPPRPPLPTKVVLPKRIPPKPKPFLPRSTAPAPQSTSKPQQNLSHISRPRRIRLLVLGGTLGLTASYIVYYLYSVQTDISHFSQTDVPADTSARYDVIASDFDSAVSWHEWALGIDNLRAKLCRRATGHVLESAVGTGRNASSYDLLAVDGNGQRKIQSVTMVDKSREMLYEARRGWPNAGNAWFMHALFRVADLSEVGARVAAPIAAGGEEGQFDTVIQTMGLCSTGHPVQLLRNLGAMCKDNGEILLLEHGRSWYDWVNGWLDGMAKGHAIRYGCWFNKDLDDIVHESGLQVVEQKRFHLGTTYWYVLKPAKRRATEIKQRHDDPIDSNPEDTSRPWYIFWAK